MTPHHRIRTSTISPELGMGEKCGNRYTVLEFSQWRAAFSLLLHPFQHWERDSDSIDSMPIPIRGGLAHLLFEKSVDHDHPGCRAWLFTMWEPRTPAPP